MWGMNIQGLPGPALILMFITAGFLYFGGLLWIISRISGWGLLARRFRTTEEFCGERWGWQSARFRWLGGYNNCLTIGANPQGLYLSVMPIMFPLRLFHPDLLIPWQEIEVETGKMFFGLYDSAQLRIGREEQVTMKIYGKLVKRVRQAAGSGWPLYEMEQMEERVKE
jgi:hypothetical protein